MPKWVKIYRLICFFIVGGLTVYLYRSTKCTYLVSSEPCLSVKIRTMPAKKINCKSFSWAASLHTHTTTAPHSIFIDLLPFCHQLYTQGYYTVYILAENYLPTKFLKKLFAVWIEVLKLMCFFGCECSLYNAAFLQCLEKNLVPMCQNIV